MTLQQYSESLLNWIWSAPFESVLLNDAQRKDLENGLEDKHKVWDEYKRVHELMKPLKRNDFHMDLWKL